MSLDTRGTKVTPFVVMAWYGDLGVNLPSHAGTACSHPHMTHDSE